MVTLLEAAGLLVLVGLNTGLAAVCTRLFRVRLETRWGGALYTLLLTPLVLLLVTMLVAGVYPLLPDLGSPATAVGVTVLLPLTLGVALDYFWMPAPDEVEVPDTL
jgi:hypothetical protein